ncbi:MAG: YihY/virulence factor BrkB family protein [Bryobacterales bacterium]|nr:YihY/virulence factor BrkB family protein [Bryobacterales bacterium]
MFELIKKTVNAFIDDDCPAMAAALAYYTVFSLPPLLAIIVAIAGAVFGAEAVGNAIREQASTMIGQGAADQIQTMMAETNRQTGGAWWKVIGSVVLLLFGATTAFGQLQVALNRTWEVKPDPNAGGIKAFIGKRLLSFGLILVLGFLMLVSLVISAFIAAAGGWLESAMGGALSAPILEAINLVVALAIVTALFAAMFKYLPDAKIEWRTVLFGAFLTAALFVTGKGLLAWYIGASDVGSAYGAAGSLILILVWIYYSSMIVLLGAEFTQQWAERHGKEVEPEEGAMRQPA